jgi:hypothetical protein
VQFLVSNFRVVDHEVSIRKTAQDVEEMSRSLSKYLTDGPPGCHENKKIVVAHFNYYCADSTTNPKYLLPSEFSFHTFSLADGIGVDPSVCGLIDPSTSNRN